MLCLNPGPQPSSIAKYARLADSDYTLPPRSAEQQVVTNLHSAEISASKNPSCVAHKAGIKLRVLEVTFTWLHLRVGI